MRICYLRYRLKNVELNFGSERSWRPHNEDAISDDNNAIDNNWLADTGSPSTSRIFESHNENVTGNSERNGL
jgi:hypothetical protein